MKYMMNVVIFAMMVVVGCQQASVVQPEMTEEQSFLNNPCCQTTYALVSEKGSAAIPLILKALDLYSGQTNEQRRCLIIQGALWKGSNCTNSQFQAIIKKGASDPSEAVRKKTNSMLEKACKQVKSAAGVAQMAGGAGQAAKPAQADVAGGHQYLCGDYLQNKIFIIDDGGKILWDYPASHVCDLWALSNSNFLFTTWHGVQEITRDKKVVFEYTTTSEVFSCQRLPDGNTLVGETTLGRLTIVDPKGKLVRGISIFQPGEKGSHGYIANIRQLPNGHFMVSSYFHNWVREFDVDGKLLKEIPVTSGGRSVVRLGNGHTLISTSQLGKDPRLFELDADNKICWEMSNRDLADQPFRMLCGIHRLPNGNTVLANFTGHNKTNATARVPQLMEITPEKKIVWSFSEYGPIKSISCVQRLDDLGEKALR